MSFVSLRIPSIFRSSVKVKNSQKSVESPKVYPLGPQYVQQGSHFSAMTKFHDISRDFCKFPGIILIYFSVTNTPFDSPTSLVGGQDMDLKFKRFLVCLFESQHNIQPLKSGLTITEILIFPGFLSFFHDIFHNFSNSMIFP